MANDKKFIVKNGLQTEENVVIGSNVDNGTDKLQVTGSSAFAGEISAQSSNAASPTITVSNSGGVNAQIALFKGDSNQLGIINIDTGDYALLNQANTGIQFNSDIEGLKFLFENAVKLEITSTAIDFKTDPTVNGAIIWHADNDGAGSGLDADLIDGLDSTQFLRSDESDTMTGDLTIDGNLTVNGTTTYINTEEILLSDNIITLNANYTGSTPTENAGVEVERGTLQNAKLIWNEASDYWQIETNGSVIGRVITTADEAKNGGNFDADTVDGLQATQFLRSDVDDTAAGNIRIEKALTVGNNTQGAYIYMDGTGNNRTIYSDAGEIGFLNGSFNYAAKSDVNDNWIVGNDVKAKRFLDTDNENWLLDPSGTSVLNGIFLGGRITHLDDVDTYLNFNAENSFEVRTGGAQRLLVNDTYVEITNEARSPKFVDSDDINFYGDFAGASRVNDVSLVGQIIHDGDTDTYLDFNAADSFQVVTGGTARLTVANTAVTTAVELVAPKLVDAEDPNFYLDPNSTSILKNLNVYSGATTGEINVGKNATERFNLYVTDGQGYIRYYQDENDNTNHSVNFEIQSSNTGIKQFTFNQDVNLLSNNLQTSGAVISSASYSSIYYDADNEIYYGDFNNTGVSLNLAGRVRAATGTLAQPTYSFANDADTGMYRFSDNVLGFAAGGNDEFRVYSSYTLSPGSSRAPIFYDSDNTGYFVDPAGQSSMNIIGIDSDLLHNGDPNTKIGFTTGKIQLFTNGSSKLTIDTNNVVSNVNLYAPRFYTNDYVYHNGDDSYIGFNANDTFGVWTASVNRLSIDTDSADFSVNTFAPRFYTNDYLVHNGDTNTYIGFDADDSFGIWTNGTQQVDVNSAGAVGIGRTDQTYKLDVSDAGISVARFTGASGGAHISLVSGTTEFRATVNNDSVEFGSESNDPVEIVTNGTTRVHITTDNQVGINTIDPKGALHINSSSALGFNPYTEGNNFLSLGGATPSYALRGDSFGNIWVTKPSGQLINADDNVNILMSVDYNTGDVIVGDQQATYPTTDASTTYVITPSANKLHVWGGLQLNNNTDVISIGRASGDANINEATFVAINELGFSAGGGFYMDDTATVKVRGNKALSTSGNITGGTFYGNKFIDTDNNNYYLDPNSTSVLNTVGIDSDLFHNGDTNTKLAFATDSVTISAGGVNYVANTTVLDSPSNVYAPRFYDRDDNAYYVDAAGDSQFNTIDIDDFVRHRGDTNTYIGFNGADNFQVVTGASQRLGISNSLASFGVTVRGVNGSLATPAYSFTGDPNSGMYLNAADVIGFSAGGNDEFRIHNTYTISPGSSRAPIFYDSDNTAFYADPGSTSVMNVVRANQYQLDGAAILIDSPNGDYGSIKVEGDKGGWAGYAIRDDYVFMSNGSSNFGIYNDTDNEWMLYGTRNAGLDLYYNGTVQAETENGYFLANNQMRAPIYYDSNNTGYYANFAAGNTGTSIKVNGQIYRDGFAAGNGDNNKFLVAEDYSHWIWNTASNWGMFWAGNDNAAYSYFSSSNPNEIAFVGGGNVRASIDLDNGNAYFQGEVIGSNFRINGGNEDLGILKTYGSGLADAMLFDATEYWDKRVIRPMQGVENNVTSSSGDWVKATDGPYAGGYVLQTGGYRQFDSDYIPVEPGEEIYAEISARLVSGSGGLLYLGVRRYDKDKKPIASNDGITYFAASAADVTSTGWTTYRGHHTLPTSHTPYNGSDGGGVKYVRLILLANYSSGGAVRQFGPPILKRSSLHSNISAGAGRFSGDVYAPRYYDSNDTGYYVDPASISYLNDVRANIYYDRNNTAYYMNPASGGKVTGTWDWTNGSIENLNSISFNDPGPNEGIHWKGGNNWRIYESPDNLSTNSGGNLQILYNNNALGLRVTTSGDTIAGRYSYAQRFYDSNDGNYYVDPAGTSILNRAILRATAALDFTTTSTAVLDHNSNSTPVAFRMNKGGTTLSDGTDFGVLQLSRTNHNNNATAAGAGLYFTLKDSAGTLREYAGILGRKTVAGTGGGELRFMTYGRAVQAYLNADYFSHVSDIRAPIFYDSNNTGYYADMASTSIFNVMRANQYQVDGSTYYIDSSNSDYGSIRVEGRKNGWSGYAIENNWVFMSNGSPTSGIFNDTDNKWAILFNRNSDVNLYFNGTWEERTRSGYMEARGSYRAPIFYDSNNTAYYANPASTSNFAGLTVGGVITSPGITGYSNALVRRDNRTIAPSEDFAGQLKFGFTSWANNSTSPYADYLHLRSYTDASGGNDNLVTFRKDSIGMRIWQRSWGSTSAYSDYRDVTLYGVGNSGALYAGIYYDGNDTNYYIDPNSTSQSARLRGRILIGPNTTWGDYLQVGGNGREFINNQSYASVVTTDGNLHLDAASAHNTYINYYDGSTTYFGNGANSIVAEINGSGYMYSPRYYDRNNTGYYADPASTSRMSVVDANDFYSRGWFRNYDSGEGLYNQATTQHFYSDSDDGWNIAGGSNVNWLRFRDEYNGTIRGSVYAENNNNIGFLSNSGSWALRTNNSTTEIYGSLYANIMYDRNNTGYYVDPASTSQLNTVYGNRFIHRDDVSQDDQFGLYFASGQSTAYAIYREGGSWSSPYPDLRIAFHTGIKMGANSSYNGMRFYNDYTMATQVMSINNGSDALGANNVYVNNSLQAGSSLRAPIFYDSNNTGYYVNPNSTSSMNVITADRFNMRDRGDWITFYGDDSDYHAISSRDTGGSTSDDIRINSYGSVFINLDSNNNNTSSADFRIGRHGLGTSSIQQLGLFDVYGDALYVYSAYSMRSPIFYDANNSGYYGDFASTSRFNAVRTNESYTYGWFRNYTQGRGLYNQANGSHLYSPAAQYWNLTGNNSNSSINLRMQSGYNSNTRLWLHGSTDGWGGFLNTAGAWKLRTRVTDGYSPSLQFREEGDETWTGNPGNDVGKIEYHSNRFYIVSGGNSNRIVQFRQDGSDRSYIANDGVFVGTATSARWADLAERYEADEIYEPGTVLGINLDGDSEVTLYQPGMPVAGAVSTNPAYRMNEHIDYLDDDSIQSKMNPFIALKGRIPVKVNGEVKKGQWVVADRDGKGKGVDYGTQGINNHDIIGIALGNAENGEVEVKV